MWPEFILLASLSPTGFAKDIGNGEYENKVKVLPAFRPIPRTCSLTILLVFIGLNELLVTHVLATSRFKGSIPIENPYKQ